MIVEAHPIAQEKIAASGCSASQPPARRRATAGAIFFLQLGALGVFRTDTFPVVTFRVSK